MEQSSSVPRSEPAADVSRERLNSWKDIASYLGRDISTVQRWEKREDMPVHRHIHVQRGSVYAFRDELDAWWQARRVQLEAESGDAAPRAPSAAARSTRDHRFLWGGAGVMAGAAVAFAIAISVTFVHRAARADAVTVVRFQLPAPPDTTYDAVPSQPSPAVSPDGRQIATSGEGADGLSRLWIHTLDSAEPRMLPGTEGADSPFWSPDGRFVAFAAGGKLLRIPAAGGPIATITELPRATHPAKDAIAGGSWSDAGIIIFADTSTGQIYRVAEGGGPAAVVTALDRSRGEEGQRFPQFLPDHRHFVYLDRCARAEDTGIYVGSLDSVERKRLAPFDSKVAFVEPGYLLFVRGVTLMAQRLDVSHLVLTGEPVPLAEGVVLAATVRAAPFSATARTLVYRTGGLGEARLLRLDRTGTVQTVIDGPARYPANPAISPDGKHVAIARLDPANGTSDIWVIDIGRRVALRLTTHPAWELGPLWSLDGRRIVFASNRDGPYDLYERDLDPGTSGGESAERPILRSSENKFPQTWAAGGADLIYAGESPTTGTDLWRLTGARSGVPTPLVRTRFDEREAQVSPDGRWLAYSSNESGRSEVYVTGFPSTAEKWRISPAGGAEPRWRADSAELFYVGPDRKLMGLPIARSTAFSPGDPTVVFNTRISDTFWWDYAVAPDGQSFIIKQATNAGQSSPLTVVLDWSALLATSGH